MITIKDFLEVIDYKITEGSEYLWDCYGSNAWYLERQLPTSTMGNTVSCVFDNIEQFVYEITAWDNLNNRVYRWIHPDYIKKYKKSCKKKQVNFKIAYDDVEYIDLDVEQDILEKAKAIANNEEYDTRVIVPLEISDTELVLIARAAHELDITINEFFERAMIDLIEKYKNISKIEDQEPCKVPCGNFMCDANGCINKRNQ